MFSHTCHKNVSVYFNLILSQGRKCYGVVSLQPGVVIYVMWHYSRCLASVSCNEEPGLTLHLSICHLDGTQQQIRGGGNHYYTFNPFFIEIYLHTSSWRLTSLAVLLFPFVIRTTSWNNLGLIIWQYEDN